ncbi:MAG: protein-export chaperone SecB [Mailhella sp.]|nr:protein-export chaperone SecB [Mailhella sp.]
MGNRGITSSFQIISCKVDKIELAMKDSSGILQKSNFPLEGWAFGVALRVPQYAPKEKVYLIGLDVKVIHGDKDDPEVKLEAGISGLFKVMGDEFSADTESKIAKIQFPTILFPYVRAAVTNILASAGYGSVVLPLVNINKLAENQLKDVEIIRIEEEQPDEQGAVEK